METCIRVFAWIGLVTAVLLFLWTVVCWLDYLLRTWISDTPLFWAVYVSACFSWIASASFRKLKMPRETKEHATVSLLMRHFDHLRDAESVIAHEFLDRAAVSMGYEIARRES